MKSRKYTSVFIGSLIISLILVALGFVPGYGEIAENWRSLIGTDFGWFYLLLVTLIVFVCGFFVLSPMGQIKLGEPDSKPEYSTGSWIAMLFSAGMGIGLVFYGSAEPLSHFASKPRMLNPGHSKQWRTLFNLPSSIGVFTLGLCTVLSLWLWHILDSVKKKSIFSR